MSVNDPHEQPTQEGPPPPRRLTRASDDRVLGGVAGGLARYFAIDPIIPRIVFAALVFAGGFGIFAYVAAWLFVPDERTGSAAVTSSRSAAVAGVVVLLVALAVVTGGGFFLFAGPGLFLLLLAAAVGYAIWAGAGERTGGALGRLVLIVLIGLLTLFGMAAAAIGAAFGGTPVMAGVVIACGLLVAIGAASGRMRWLLVPAVLLAIPVGVVAAADLDVSGGIGEREYRPVAATEIPDRYELGVGDLVVDLRDADLPDGVTPVDLRLGVGRAVVLVGEDVCVAPDVDLRAGSARILGRETAGVDVEVRHGRPGSTDGPVVALSADVGLGELVVSNVHPDENPAWRMLRPPGEDRRLFGDGCVIGP